MNNGLLMDYERILNDKGRPLTAILMMVSILIISIISKIIMNDAYIVMIILMGNINC